ncbi:LysR family transcriptional regulator [Vibrio algarum]|uniref:LysR family transcriptional regulator n=1 Tax=Vibrio algarum TaxID=3020714 RepID=A0ABT4YPV0_9VIBR|nr:LysR family transcriptional regulator [Vibrio sp. KJ40-1]MDB1123422.1 LysR family transcriptional regulator [Vibrio sp. KJ40-1]
MLEHTRHLAVFAVVAEVGSFRGAAKRLGISPAAVSGHVTQLEESLNVALIYRSTRKLWLTDLGRKVASEGQAILDAELAAIDIVEEHNRTPKGKLRVSVPSWLQNGRFVDDIARFSTIYPETEIDLTFSDSNADLIGEGIDLALRVGPVADSALKCRHLLSIQELLVASPSYLKGKPPLMTPDNLEKHRFVSFAAMQLNPVFISKKPEKKSYQKVSIKSQFSVESVHFAYKFALSGVGLAIIPDLLAERHIKDGELIELLPEWRLQAKEILAIWPANAGKWSPARILVDFLVQDLIEYGEQDELTRRHLPKSKHLADTYQQGE